jgi:putative hydrolase of the HAD superfamily
LIHAFDHAFVMSTQARYRAVLFDMDETLIAHGKGFEEIAHETYKAFADQLAPITEKKYWATFWPKAVDLWFMMFDGVIDGDTARRYAHINTLRTLGADETLAEPMMHFGETVLVECADLIEDAHRVLQALRHAGIITGVVTNGYATTQRRKVAYHELEEKVDFVLVGEEVGAQKPDPRIFQEALRLAGTSADATLFVGDMPANDIKGALDAGMDAALYDIGGKWHDIRETKGMPEPTYTIKSLSEVLGIVGLNDASH